MSKFSGPFVGSFYSGTVSSSTEIPGRYIVGLGGRGFIVDLESDAFQHQSIPLLRQQADQSSRPGEQSINPDSEWRRTTSSWHYGAGQTDYDADDEASEFRFYSSKGIDPWTKNRLSLLPDTDEKKSSSNTNLRVCPAGGYLYLTDGTAIQYTEDITAGSPTWTDITGEPGTPASAITSDGNSVWTAHGSDGVYVTTRGAGSTASSFTGTITGVKYVKGRLFGWAANEIYNLTTPGAIPAALLEHPNGDFAWVDVAEAAGYYFLAGYSGDKSIIYRTQVKQDGTALADVFAAAELPDGEIVRAIQGYLGFVVIGTDKGIRFGSPDSSGNITLGGLIDEVPGSLCFEGQGRFVWFGWNQYDGSSTGLGRMDLASFNGTVPAFASDLMCSENGDVLSIATFQDRRVFTVSGDGVFAEDSNLVASGTLETGQINYGLFDPKVTTTMTVVHSPLVGTIGLAVSKDGGAYANLSATNPLAGEIQSEYPTNRARGERFQFRWTLSRDGSDATAGPEIRRYTLEGYPASARSLRITVPLILGDHQRLANGSGTGRSVNDDLEFLAQLEANGSSVRYQEGAMAYEVVVESHVWIPHHAEKNNKAFAGTYIAQLKKFAED